MMPTLIAIASLILGVAIVAVIQLGVLISQQADLKAYTMTAIDLLQQLVKAAKGEPPHWDLSEVKQNG